MTKVVRLNAVPSKPDSRDLVYRCTSTQVATSIDLREYDTRIENQSTLGSCTAMAISTGYEVMTNILYPEKAVEVSSLFLYYHSRLFSDTLETDSGSYIRDGLKSIKNFGVCSEVLWPYDIDKYDQQPTPLCYLDATKRRISSYSTLYTNDEIKEVLSSKRPVVLATEIFYDFLYVTKDNPRVKMPSAYDYSMGQHAVLIMGYDDSKSEFLIKNSHGSYWGDNGYAWIPYDYVSAYGFERWCFDIANPSSSI